MVGSGAPSRGAPKKTAKDQQAAAAAAAPGKSAKRAKSSATGGGAPHKVVVLRTSWNKEIVDALVDGCVKELEGQGVQEVLVQQVPGAFELPFACQRTIQVDKPDAVVAIGCLIKGDTMHFEYICEAVSHGLMRVGLDSDVPVIFGVLTCLTQDQAKMRAGLIPGHHNHGPEWGAAAVDMAKLKKKQ